MCRPSRSTAPAPRTTCARIRAVRVYGGRLLADEYPERALFPGGTTAGAVRGGARPAARGHAPGLSGRPAVRVRPVTRAARAHLRLPLRVGRADPRHAGAGTRQRHPGDQSGRARRVRRAPRDRAVSQRAGPLAGFRWHWSPCVAVDLHPALELQPVWPAAPPIYGAIAADSTAVLAEFPIHHQGAGRDRQPAVHVFLAVALAADGQRLQRIHHAGVSAAAAGHGDFPGAGGAGRVARARRDPRQRQLRVLCWPGARRCSRRWTTATISAPSRRDGGRAAWCGSTRSVPEQRANAVARPEGRAYEHGRSGYRQGRVPSPVGPDLQVGRASAIGAIAFDGTRSRRSRCAPGSCARRLRRRSSPGAPAAAGAASRRSSAWPQRPANRSAWSM